MTRTTKTGIAVLMALLLSAPADARKVTNPDWEAWNHQRQSFCAFFAAAGFRTPKLCRGI